MTIRLSEGLRNRMAQGMGFARALHNGWIDVRSGAQPTSADAAGTGGTRLGIITISSGTHTPETRATGTLTVTGITAVALTEVKIGTLPIVVNPGRVVGSADTTATAALIADAINSSGIASATSAANVITIKAPPGVGADWNTLATTAAGITCTAGAMSGGVAAANGLYLAQPVAGVISKPTGVVWSCAGLASGTAGWFRFYSSDTADTGGLITTLTEPLFARMDGSVGVGSGDMQLSSLGFSAGPTVTVDVASFTMPAA